MNRTYILLPFTLISLVLLIVLRSHLTSNEPQLEALIETFAESDQEKLYSKIQSYAAEHSIPAIDAKIDPIWKAIPGYNGLEVDIVSSFKNMIQLNEFQKDKLVYIETSPKLHLNDLDPSPIYRGNPEKSMVALLINVAWGNEFIPGILKTLKDNQVYATFFFDGSWVKNNPDLALMINLEGHEIGNHAYSHPDLQKKSRDEVYNELLTTNEVIKETIAFQPIWFAPPSGSFNQQTIDVADELEMKTILWTVDTVDWKKPATAEMVSRVVSGVENGSMILMHPTKPVFEGLESMIGQIKAKGYQLGTVSELMSEKRITK
jgi:probable sporulation protein (polysaccharide deacetylase family)